MISLEGENYHFGPFDLVRVSGCYGHNCVLGGSHIQYYLSLGAVLICPKGVLWLICVLRGKFHLPLLNRGGGLLIKWKRAL